jgi:hypothetical protein
MIQPPFFVPANVNTLTHRLDIGNVIVSEVGKGATTTITGPWHFVFTVPFHHENNSHIVAPIVGDVFTFNCSPGGILSPQMITERG